MICSTFGYQPRHSIGVNESWVNYIYDMERKIDLHIEKLPEGVYLATSDSIQGLVAQGRTISETLEIARDVAKKLLEAQEGTNPIVLPEFDNEFDLPLVIGM